MSDWVTVVHLQSRSYKYKVLMMEDGQLGCRGREGKSLEGCRKGVGVGEQSEREEGKKVQINHHPSGIITPPPSKFFLFNQARWCGSFLQPSLIIYMSVFSLMSPMPTKNKTFYICMQPVAWQSRFQRSDLLSCFKLNDDRSGELLTKEALRRGWRCQQGFKLHVCLFFLSSCCILVWQQP